MDGKTNIRKELDQEYRKYYDRCVQFAKSYLYDIHDAQTVASLTGMTIDSIKSL